MLSVEEIGCPWGQCSLGLPPMEDLVSVVHDCSKQKNLAYARHVHAHLCSAGLDADVTLGNHMIMALVNCGSVPSAQQAIRKQEYQNKHSWISRSEGYIECGGSEHALVFSQNMPGKCTAHNCPTLHTQLKVCSLLKCVERGHQLHTEIVKEGLETDPLIGRALVDMYLKCCSLLEASQVFRELPTRNVVLWTAYMTAYAECGHDEEALHMFEKMQDEGIAPDAVAFLCITKVCGNLKAINRGRQIHCDIAKEGLESDPAIGATLISMYAKCDCMAEMQEVFDDLPVQDIVAWNALITAYTEQGLEYQALECLDCMQLRGIALDATTFICILKACSSSGNLDRGRDLHSEIVMRGLDSNLPISNTLVDMYAKSGLSTEAKALVDKLPFRNVVSWNALISAYSEQGFGEKVLCTFEKLKLDGLLPDAVTFISVLKGCCSVQAVDMGQILHFEIVTFGMERDPSICSSLVGMYANCGFFHEAWKVFDELPDRNVVSWSALITGYVEQGHGEQALRCLEQMQLEGVSANKAAFVSGLKACCITEDIEKGHELHCEIVRQGFEKDLIVGNSLVDMYVKSRLFLDAEVTFTKLSNCNVVSWNALMTGFADNGYNTKVLDCLEKMKLEGIFPNNVTYVCILRACGSMGDISCGQEIHTQIVKDGHEEDPFIGNTLVDMYGKCGSFIEARDLLEKMPNRDIVTWNALIAAYAEHGLCDQAFELLKQMQHGGFCTDAVTLAAGLKACTKPEALEMGKKLHAEAILKGFEGVFYIGSTLVEMYVNCGSLGEAELVLNGLSVQNAVSWNALLAGYAEEGLGEKALKCLELMQLDGLLPDTASFVFSLQACGSLFFIGKGRQLHTEIVEKGLEADPYVGTALLDMYMKCGSHVEAQEIFDDFPVHNEVTWTALIAGYVEHSLNEQALSCLQQMQLEGVLPNAVTYVCSLKACGNMGVLNIGQKLHAEIVIEGWEQDSFLGNALIDMYGECGLVTEAKDVFEELPVQDVVSWTSLIAGYSCQGETDTVFLLFDRMQGKSLQPDSLTLLSILTACSHAGLVEKGRKHLEEFLQQYDITLTVEHKNSLIDLFGRAGQLDVAMMMLERLFSQHDCVAWNTLLSSCQKWENIEFGEVVFRCGTLFGQHPSAFILMSNIHANAHMRRDVGDNTVW